MVDRIISSPTAFNLVRVCGLQERLKGFGKDSDFKAQRVHASLVPASWAAILRPGALRGMTVTLQDQALERIARPSNGRSRLFAETAQSLKGRAAFRPPDPPRKATACRTPT